MSQWSIEPTPVSNLILLLGLTGAVLTFFTPLKAIGVAFFGLSGLLISLHLYQEKKEEIERHVCPVGEDCARVITSSYSRFMGISVEVLGALYYVLILAGYSILALAVHVPSWAIYLLLVASGMAVLFSVYLIYLQGVTLRMWCVWCVSSAILSGLIFVGAITRLGVDALTILDQFSQVSQLCYLLAVALGFGAAATNDIFTLKFFHGLEIDEFQAGILKKLLEMTWASLGIILLMGGFWIVPGFGAKLGLPVVQLSIIILAVLIVNGAILYFYVAERMVRIRYVADVGPGREEERQEVLARTLAFALSPVSAVSWGALLVLTFREFRYGLPELLAGYVAVVLLGVAAGIAAEKVLKLETEGRFEAVFE